MTKKMKPYFTKPDFCHSVLNVSATLAEFLGAPNSNPILDELQTHLNKRPQKLVCIVFDGMGVHPLSINKTNCPFLTEHIVSTLTSTFPSTTTCATTSLETNTYPLQHGWFGWSMYFPDAKRNIDIFLGTDSETGESVQYESPLADKTDFYYYKANCEYAVHTVYAPHTVPHSPVINHPYDDLEDFFVQLESICATDGKQFVYAYCHEPDHTMHENGVSSLEAATTIAYIDSAMQKLAQKYPLVTFVVTADHGQVDINDFTEFYLDKELCDMLVCPPYMEARAAAFRVKPQYKEIFVRKFNQRYGDDFVLYPSQRLIDEGFFGPTGDKGYLLGDFIAIGTDTNKSLLPYENSPRFKGHHTSLTQEILVPLIVIDSK